MMLLNTSRLSGLRHQVYNDYIFHHNTVFILYFFAILIGWADVELAGLQQSSFIRRRRFRKQGYLEKFCAVQNAHVTVLEPTRKGGNFQQIYDTTRFKVWKQSLICNF
jgi:hypothetical protein